MKLMLCAVPLILKHLLPASVQVKQANWLACKQGNISGPSRILKRTSLPKGILFHPMKKNYAETKVMVMSWKA